MFPFLLYVFHTCLASLASAIRKVKKEGNRLWIKNVLMTVWVMCFKAAMVLAIIRYATISSLFIVAMSIFEYTFYHILLSRRK